MTKNFPVLLIFPVFLSLFSMGQSPVRWKTNPLEDKVFIENKGQFDGMDQLKNSTIYYEVFTPDENGLNEVFLPKGVGASILNITNFISLTVGVTSSLK